MVSIRFVRILPLCRPSTLPPTASTDCEPVAYGYFGIGPVAGLDRRSAARALQAELARSARGEVTVTIPGTATAMVEVALCSGLRLSDPGLLLLSPSEQPPPSALAIHSYWLM